MRQILILFTLLLVLCSGRGQTMQSVKIHGEQKVWHKITLLIDGPETAEFAKDNPFLNYRLVVTFSNGNKRYKVPGFYCADGDAAETSAEEGNKWMVRFRPDEVGIWDYSISFRKGKDIAVSSHLHIGKPVGPDGFKGSFVIVDSDKKAPDFRGTGRLEYVGKRYLKFAGRDSFFIKNGADSPENFLAFVDFDQTYRYGTNEMWREGEANPKEECHYYSSHVKDWKKGDPIWKESNGKGIIGVVNYLASKDVNSIYMLLLNVQGDGNDVWPWIDYNERYRFDCSKLDQWEIVFDHMEKQGIMLHLVLQETENECLLDIGQTGVQRKLYYREMVARFAHHLAITWNLGEENGPAHWTPIGQTDQQRKSMAAYLKHINPYSSFIVLHTHWNDSIQDKYLLPLVGFEALDGPSMQIGEVGKIHRRIRHFIQLSSNSEKQWVVNLDELGPAYKGIMPDEFDANHDTVRHYALWGSLMAGAGGAEWYFGYKYPHNDLECEDLRSRDLWWNQTRIATEFFSRYLHFSEMESADEIIDNKEAYCLAKQDEVYVVYLPKGNIPTRIELDSSGKDYSIHWYDPRHGGKLQTGTVSSFRSPGKMNIGFPPIEKEKDWVALVRVKQ
ncbi:Putative collagen-binding domain of a collagenase [Mariniphaga anaerophila]|uniref:Putative collagen-binding domain of a collagenase n=1 Tax=Mariniphaga anaerophila TaxID=1484053 RepID=A0A1M4ZTK5_9BACT|nr:DUF5060 domain-containing protein [Mariniphaga anaerophila]SHF21383.1 Putative collagen-binding domain of a collagenase [Mariniphaga anaerophila]